jgi:hypothetical protein
MSAATLATLPSRSEAACECSKRGNSLGSAHRITSHHVVSIKVLACFFAGLLEVAFEAHMSHRHCRMAEQGHCGTCLTACSSSAMP